MAPYQYIIEHGDAWFVRDQEKLHIADSTGLMAVLVDNGDPEDGIAMATLCKHGTYPAVSKYAAELGRKLITVMPRYADSLEVLAFPVHQDIIDELNACIECTGRIGRFKAFLTDFGARHTEIQINPGVLADHGISTAA